MRPTPEEWSTEHAAELYRIDAWGEGYFAIDPSSGHVVARPSRTTGPSIDLMDVVTELGRQGFQTPVVIRFSNILEDRIASLHDAFATAISEHGYPGEYRALYPIKVNQQRAVVDEVYRFGRRFKFGLEVGSKPELLAVMASAEDPDRLVVCNGFKDDRYIEAIILATKLGRSIIPIVENFSELGLILKHARAYGVKPRLGVRVKLASQGAGRWRDSGGTRSKFGLFPSELLDVHETLERQGLADCLELVHCHPGSQVQDIQRLKDALNELASVYVELARLGSGVRYLDVGGGLGVDYRGVQAAVDSSMNYTLEEYASDVVYRVATACSAADVAAPTLLSESGRAMVAHHSVLVFDVLGRSGTSRSRVTETLPELEEVYPELPVPIRDLFEARDSLSPERLIECYHDAQQAREQAVQLFRLGYVDLRLRGLADRLFWSICTEVERLATNLEDVPEELGELETILSDIYFCNLSIFQSLPDSWAIDQLFPVMPIHRLDSEPTVKAVLADLTCDSDGKVDSFVGDENPSAVLDVHALEVDEPYYLAAFLVGAYQETLGDLHNLFGDTHVAHVELDGDGAWSISEVVEGDSAAEVLRYVGYSPDVLYERLRRECTESVSEGAMSGPERRTLLTFYRDELAGYTYFEHR